MGQLARISFVVEQKDKKVRIYVDGLQHGSKFHEWNRDPKRNMNVLLPLWWKSLTIDEQNGATAKYEGSQAQVNAKNVIEAGNFDGSYLDLQAEPMLAQIPLKGSK